jgi:pilus assembly protein CpaC
VLRDGESFAIAGLINNNVTKEIDKVKYLGDIPIIGYFFKSISNQKSTDELLVVITPHFVKPISKDEKAKLPDFPETFLPTVREEQMKKKKKGNKDSADSTPASPDQAQFTGARGYQEPTK